MQIWSGSCMGWGRCAWSFGQLQWPTNEFILVFSKALGSLTNWLTQACSPSFLDACDGLFYVNLARLLCPAIWWNVSLDVALKVFCIIDVINIYHQLTLHKVDYTSIIWVGFIQSVGINSNQRRRNSASMYIKNLPEFPTCGYSYTFR